MLLVFIVLAGGSGPSVFGHYLSDLTLPSTLNDQHQLSAEVEDVTTAEKCLSSGKILYENRCYELLTEGPCGYGQWLVLDDRWDGGSVGLQRYRQNEQRVSSSSSVRTTEPTAKCARRRCSESDVYWPRDGFCYDAGSAHRRRLCPGTGTVLATDYFGDGYCACLNHDRDGEIPYVRLNSGNNEDVQDEDEDARPCYAAYARGPCRRGHVITPLTLGYGNCTVDRCADKRRWPQQLQQQLHLDHQQQQQQFRDNTPLAPWADSLCYELGTRGPCTDQEKFSVARDVVRPACVVTVALQLDLFSDKRTTETTPAGSMSSSQEQSPCKTNHRGECVEGVDVPTGDPALAFREQLLESARRHAQRNKEKKKKRTPPGKHEQ